jgi:hypothetical protein
MQVRFRGSSCMLERREHRRLPCRIDCDLHLPGRTIQGSIRSLSEGGLSLRVPADPPEQGDPVRIMLRPQGFGAFEVQALAWHARRLERASTGPSLTEIGLVLSAGSDPFFALLGELRQRSAEPRLRSRSAPAPPALRQFAVRVKQEGGPRSCRIVVGATASEEATGRALDEVGTGWVALEVRPL